MRTSLATRLKVLSELMAKLAAFEDSVIGTWNSPTVGRDINKMLATLNKVILGAKGIKRTTIGSMTITNRTSYYQIQRDLEKVTGKVLSLKLSPEIIPEVGSKDYIAFRI